MAEQLHADATAVIGEMEKLRNKYLPQLEKHTAHLKTMHAELVAEPMAQYNSELRKFVEGTSDAPVEPPKEPQLTVMAQALYEREMDKAFEIVRKLNHDHRSLHKGVSRCGKDLDKYFEADLTNLLKNEKDIEEDVANRSTVDRMMFEYFLETGMTDVADALKKECALPIASNKVKIHEDLKTVMDLYRQRKFTDIIDFLDEFTTKKDDHYNRIIFQLHSMNFLHILQDQNKYIALDYCRKFEPFGKRYTGEIQHLMGALHFYPKISPNYDDLFHPNNIPALESCLMHFVSNVNSALETLVNVGADALPQMLSIRSVFNSRSLLPESEELPITIDIPNSCHSTFTCPILKTQASQNNPPVRLACGHVISKEAVNKLSNNRYMRQTRVSRHGNRMKCPYCPEEINIADNVLLYFN
uniref:RING-Gid-type domain-containing protein n=1 Tax=Panagrellus redivivus TaxID=6233 RepID=A0A7E4UQS1_PANRE